MQKTNSQARNMRRQIQNSTTLSRKYVRRPQTSVNTMSRHSAKTAHTASGQIQVKLTQGSSARSVQSTINTTGRQLTAKELKDQAIRKALENATVNSEQSKKTKKTRGNKIHFGFGRVLLAVSCATAAVLAIVYFVNISMPDISLQVAAMQTGIDASYPSYIPRDFSVSSITSEDGKVAMDFVNSDTGDAFTLIEETSSWDSSALESNYVKNEFSDEYTIVREQGLTIYISGSNAAWVSGGVVFKLNTTSGSLTNKQIKSIAVSV